MAHRFFLPTLTQQSNAVQLEGDQAHHVANVMRMSVRDTITLFNGAGLDATCEITSISKKRVELQVVDTKQVTRRLDGCLAIAVAMPKGDRQKVLVEKLVELGVRHLIPLKCQRSVAVVNDKALARIGKQIVEATKQCERSHLMQVHSPMTLSEVDRWQAEIAISDTQSETVTDEPSQTPGTNSLKLFGDPQTGQPASRWLAQPLRSALILIGPEGGFDDDEINWAHAQGYQPLRIGKSILRVETAAIAAAALFASLE